jgi:uncharacterized protein (TIGR03437 family)
MRILLALLVMPAAVLAQAPVTIASVVNLDSGDTRLAPGSRALVTLTGIVDQGAVTAQLSGRPAGILGGSGDRIFLLVPVDVPAGPAPLVVRSRGTDLAAFPLTLVSHAPVLANTSFWPGIYCPVLAHWGTTLVAYGLGAIDIVVPPGAVAPSTPPAATVLKPTVTVGGREAQVLSSVLVPDRTNDGSYAINIRIPAGTPVGNHPVVLSIGGQSSNIEMLRVADTVIRSAATGLERSGAPESMSSAYSCATPFATVEAAADPRNPPTQLAGTTVGIKDSAGVERLSPILYVSSRQVNYIIPSGTANGPATVTITSGDGGVSTAAVQIESVAPSLFTVSGYPAALLVRVRDGTQTIEPVVRTREGWIEQSPIDLGPETDQVFLVLFGTGIRGLSTLAAVRVTIDGVDAPVEYAGPQGQFAGLDQVNVRLPRALSGRNWESLELLLTVDREMANGVYLAFR